MATIIPRDGEARQVAQELLDIVGADRVHEVQAGTAPLRFEVPDDVAVEFERRLRERNQSTEDDASEPKRAGRKPARRRAATKRPEPEQEPEQEQGSDGEPENDGDADRRDADDAGTDKE